MCFLVGQLHVVPVFGGLVLILIKYEIQNSDGINSLWLKVPVVALGLLLNGKRGIVHRSVLEEILPGLLQLHDELLAALVLAIDVENGSPVAFSRAQILVFQIRERRNLPLLLPQ